MQTALKKKTVLRLFVELFNKQLVFFDRDETELNLVTDFEVGPSSPKKQKTLMDFARAETYWPRFKNNDQIGALTDYLNKYAHSEQNGVEVLDLYVKNSRIQSKVLQYDAALLLFKKKCCGVLFSKCFALRRALCSG